LISFRLELLAAMAKVSETIWPELAAEMKSSAMAAKKERAAAGGGIRGVFYR
jgi:hypothetical protein